MNSASRVLRTLRMAISAPAKMPLVISSANTISKSVPMRAGAEHTGYAAPDVDAGSIAAPEQRRR
jgi:hypothetical protein